MKKAYILVVDDEETIRETIRIILEENGYKVDTAKNGVEAIEKSKRNYYDVALLDIRLPDIEGTKLLTKMKDTVPKMVKIMVTGYASMENAIEALNYGADAYITKPVSPDELLKVIDEKLRAKREAEVLTEEKVAKWIETRASKIEGEMSENKGKP